MPLTRSKRNACFHVPWLEASDVVKDPMVIRKYYERTNALAIRNFASRDKSLKYLFGRKSIQQLFEKHPTRVGASWCVENGAKTTGPEDVFGSTSEAKNKSWYVSFIMQKNDSVFKDMLRCLPFHGVLPLGSEKSVKYRDVVWFFFGQNVENESLRGRPEHTDAVSDMHATWHLQLRGTKYWYLKPTDELCKRKNITPRETSVRVECRAGDLLILNTANWWHRTEIPSTRNSLEKCSLSFARDLRFVSADEESDSEHDAVVSTNIDCIYAPRNIPEGTVIFTEDDLPDCELHTSQSPNCEVTETDSGLGVVVSIRDIPEGEVYTILGGE